MAKKNNMIRLKVDFEHIPMIDQTRRIKNEEDFDDLIGELKLKLFGK